MKPTKTASAIENQRFGSMAAVVIVVESVLGFLQGFLAFFDLLLGSMFSMFQCLFFFMS
jgi:hypothetical protein